MHHPSESAAAISQKESAGNGADPEDTAEDEIDLFPAELEEIVGKFSEPEANVPEAVIGESNSASHVLTLVPTAPGSSPDVPAPDRSVWTSAAKTRAWLDSLKVRQTGKDWFQEEWIEHRGIISIALSSAVLLAVIFQWTAMPSAQPGQPRDLTAFERVLVSVGLAEPPQPAAASVPGNPQTKVWVDVHTALYYCPGAELYGKTPGGKYATQLDAQRDNFQPSTLKACD